MDMAFNDILWHGEKPLPEFWDDTVKSIVCLGIASVKAYLKENNSILGKRLSQADVLLER
jgi:hypothetical protein